MRVALHHQTRYDYDRQVALGPQLIRLRPAAHTRTPILSYTLSIKPQEHYLHWMQDPYSNFMARLFFTNQTAHFEVVVDLIADMTVINPFAFFIEPGTDSFPFEYDPWLKDALQPYLATEPQTPLLTKLIEQLPKQADQTVQFLIDVNRVVSERVRYLVRMEAGVQTPEHTLEIGEGSCRDSTWLLIQAFRHMGLAARFVSGYLIQLKAETKALVGTSGVEEDTTDLHAWAEVYIPGAGWIGLDPTSGRLTGEGHIPLAATPSPMGAAPITGSSEVADTTMHHEMTLTRV